MTWLQPGAPRCPQSLTGNDRSGPRALERHPRGDPGRLGAWAGPFPEHGALWGPQVDRWGSQNSRDPPVLSPPPGPSGSANPVPPTALRSPLDGPACHPPPACEGNSAAPSGGPCPLHSGRGRETETECAETGTSNFLVVTKKNKEMN